MHADVFSVLTGQLMKMIGEGGEGGGGGGEAGGGRGGAFVHHS